jgi:hypothetical protein
MACFQQLRGQDRIGSCLSGVGHEPDWPHNSRCSESQFDEFLVSVLGRICGPYIRDDASWLRTRESLYGLEQFPREVYAMRFRAGAEYQARSVIGLASQ